MKLKPTILITIFLFGASCATPTKQPPSQDMAAARQNSWAVVENGMTKDQVFQILGHPEKLRFVDSSSFKERWVYPYSYEEGERRWVTFEHSKVVDVVVAPGPAVMITGVPIVRTRTRTTNTPDAR